MTKFPGTIEIDKKGWIEFRPVQWKWFIKNFGIKAKTLNGQRKAIKKIVIEAIKRGILEANSHK